MNQGDVTKLPEGMHRFSDGLYLTVKGNARSWILRIQKNGRRRDIGLGSAKVLSLGMAKAKALKVKIGLDNGDSAEKTLGREPSALFKDVALKAIANKCAVTKYKEQVVRRIKTPKPEERHYQLLAKYAAPLNNLKVSEITQERILAVLKPIWETKNPTASRLRQTLELVFDYAYNTHLMTTENPARWKHRLENFLPSPDRIHKVEHMDSLSLGELQAAIAYGTVSSGIGWKAVVFGALTATRTIEFCLAKWDEINFKTKVWSVAPSHRKGNHTSPFRIPLSTQAIALLKELPHTSEYVFPGTVEGHLNTQTPRVLLIKLLKRKTTMHGCRGTFKTWTMENDIDSKLAEVCLSHKVADNDVEAAYIRTDLLDKRRPIMQRWADVICCSAS